AADPALVFQPFEELLDRGRLGRRPAAADCVGNDADAPRALVPEDAQDRQLRLGHISGGSRHGWVRLRHSVWTHAKTICLTDPDRIRRLLPESGNPYDALPKAPVPG